MTVNRPQETDRSSFESDNEDDVLVAKTPNQVAEDIDDLADQKMPRSQLGLIIFLGVLGLGVVILGIVQMSNLLTLPWPSSLNGQTETESRYEQLSEEENVLLLKNKDTDEDGLSDYDEMNVYNTSAYLVDSDSDGINDKDEVDQQTDPNCPEGETCFGFTDDTGNTTALDPVDTSSTTLYVPTPQELRQLLLQSGELSEEQVNQFTDEELMDVYDQMLIENPDLSQQVDTGSQEVENLYNKSGDEIRQLLREQGIDEASLSALTDEELQVIYLEALDEANGNLNE